MGAADYEALVEELEVLRDIHVSEKQLEEGLGIPHDQVAGELRALISAAPNTG